MGMTTSRVALLGPGKMGAPMGHQLIAAGHQLTVWARREASAAASDQLADEGANAFKPAEPDEFGANPDDDFAQDALF